MGERQLRSGPLAVPSGVWCSVLLCWLGLIATVPSVAEQSASIDERHYADLAVPVVRVAVLAFREKDLTLARWRPLTDYLNAQVDDAHFELHAYTNREMDDAVARGRVDFVFVQPSHYVVLTYTHGLSSPLATLVNRQGGSAVSQFAGVMFTRAERSDIRRLSDLRDKLIAAPGLTGLGSFQMQAYELFKTGMRIPDDIRVLKTDQPQDRVVRAVLSGDADVGFVRTGLLESMSEAGKLDITQIKVIEPRNYVDFPYVASTALYPEWPFAAMTHIEPDLARRVAAALLTIPHDGDLARSMGIAGFTIPGDYRSIDQLLREMRMPPFDTEVGFTIREVWERWQGEWLGLMGMVGAVLLYALFRLSSRNRALLAAQQGLYRSTEQVRRLSQAVEQSPESILITDVDGSITYVNDAFLRNTGYRLEEVLGRNPRLLRSGRNPPAVYQDMWATLRRGQVWEGELVNRRKDGSEFIESAILSPIHDQRGALTGYLAVKQDITERRADEQRIEQLVFCDPLTNMPNRSRLTDLLARRLAQYARPVHVDALILVNIDRFKRINDARGHPFGDALLIAFSHRLTAMFGQSATVARMGADEFGLLFPDLGADQAKTLALAAHRAETLLVEAARPFSVEGESISMTLSVGVATWPDCDDTNPGDVLRRADTALHRAKDSGGNQMAVFEATMSEVVAENFRIEAELRDALVRDELVLYLQPQVLSGGALHGAEVLVRWNHPQRGLVGPGSFVPIAEHSDLIVDLSEFIMREACRILIRAQSLSIDLRLSVNLSPRHFRKQSFVPWFKALLDETGVDPTRLTLEITEGLFMDNLSEIAARMDMLCALGVRFSIDDFGTGYSSLAYLKRLPIRELKIDRSFVQDAPSSPGDAALVDTILAVAGLMRLDTVAEGVETGEQASFLDSRHGVIRQGFLYGRPREADYWLARWAPTIGSA